jgi:soluble P-type ATPase
MANRMFWQLDDETGLPSKLAGFDPNQAVAHNRGKPAAIRELRRQHPYQNVVMIGDGITDLEAVQETGAADLFIGYGGVAVRPAAVQLCNAMIHAVR